MVSPVNVKESWEDEESLKEKPGNKHAKVAKEALKSLPDLQGAGENLSSHGIMVLQPQTMPIPIRAVDLESLNTQEPFFIQIDQSAVCSRSDYLRATAAMREPTGMLMFGLYLGDGVKIECADEFTAHRCIRDLNHQVVCEKIPKLPLMVKVLEEINKLNAKARWKNK